MRRLFVAIGLVFFVAIAIGGAILRIETERLEGRLQVLETELARAEGTISSLEFYGGLRHETRLGLVEAKAAMNAVVIRDHEHQLNSLRGQALSGQAWNWNLSDRLYALEVHWDAQTIYSAVGKLRAARDLAPSQPNLAKALAFSGLAELIGAGNSSCRGPSIVAVPAYYVPDEVRGFFREGNPYVIVGHQRDDKNLVWPEKIQFRVDSYYNAC